MYSKQTHKKTEQKMLTILIRYLQKLCIKKFYKQNKTACLENWMSIINALK